MNANRIILPRETRARSTKKHATIRIAVVCVDHHGHTHTPHMPLSEQREATRRRRGGICFLCSPPDPLYREGNASLFISRNGIAYSDYELKRIPVSEHHRFGASEKVSHTQSTTLSRKRKLSSCCGRSRTSHVVFDECGPPTAGRTRLGGILSWSEELRPIEMSGVELRRPRCTPNIASSSSE